MQRSHAIALLIAYVFVLAGLGAMLVSVSTSSPDEVHNKDTSQQIHRYVWE